MAITITGGSGSGSTSVAVVGNSSLSLFTTPATANTIFLIDWFAACDGTKLLHIGNISVTDSGSASGRVRAGPSTAIKIAASVTTATTVYWEYCWVGITFS